MVHIHETYTCTFTDHRRSLTVTLVLVFTLDMFLVMDQVRSAVVRIGSGSVLDSG